MPMFKVVIAFSGKLSVTTQSTDLDEAESGGMECLFNVLDAAGIGYEAEFAETDSAEDSDAPEPVDPWADDPVYGSEDWRQEVANGDTRRSYADWVAEKRASETEEG